jgi:hypothetical protein
VFVGVVKCGLFVAVNAKRVVSRGIVARSVITSAGKSNAIVPRVFFTIYNNMTIASDNTTARVCARAVSVPERRIPRYIILSHFIA